MGRKQTPTAAPPLAVNHADAAAAMKYRYKAHSHIGMASEPDTPLGAASKAIIAERDRLNARAGPLADRVAALAALVAELGLTDAAERAYAADVAARTAWAADGDWSLVGEFAAPAQLVAEHRRAFSRDPAPRSPQPISEQETP